MKTLINFTSGVILILFSAACNKIPETGIEITGVVEEQGITSYQYGTHTLTNDENYFAIKSDSLDLDAYLNMEVTVRAYKIEGYPVDGGPEYLNVVEIKEVERP